MIKLLKIKNAMIFLAITIIICISGCILFEDNDNKEINTNDYGPLVYYIPLNFENITQSYFGIVGPMVDNNQNPIQDVEIILFLNNNTYSNMTNESGFTNIIIPLKIINNTDLSQKYNVKAFKKEYGETTWKSYLKIVENTNNIN